MGPVPKEDRNNPSQSNKDELLMAVGFAAMENEDSDDNSSDDEDAGDITNGGYQLLSQDTELIPDIEQDLSPGAAGGAGILLEQSSIGQPDISPQLAKVLPREIPKADLSTVVTYKDSPESLEQRRESMAKDDLIRAAMSGFTLPRTAMPQWANFVSEQDWKSNLMQTIGKEETKEDANAKRNSDKKS